MNLGSLPPKSAETKRRLRLQESLNTMWQIETAKQKEQLFKSPRNDGKEQSNVEKLYIRRGRRGLQTIEFLERKQRENFLNQKTNQELSTANRGEALIARAAFPINSQKQTVVLKMPPNVPSNRTRNGGAIYKRQEQSLSFEEIESSIKKILQKSQSRKLVMNSATMTNWDSPIPPTTTALKKLVGREPVLSNSHSKRHIQMRHKFIQSSRAILVECATQTDIIQDTPSFSSTISNHCPVKIAPYVKDDSGIVYSYKQKQINSIGVNTSFIENNNITNIGMGSKELPLEAVASPNPIEFFAAPPPISTVTSRKNAEEHEEVLIPIEKKKEFNAPIKVEKVIENDDTLVVESKTLATINNLLLDLEKEQKEVKRLNEPDHDLEEKKGLSFLQKPETPLVDRVEGRISPELPKLGATTPIEKAKSPSPIPIGYKSNFSEALKKKKNTEEAIYQSQSFTVQKTEPKINLPVKQKSIKVPLPKMAVTSIPNEEFSDDQSSEKSFRMDDDDNYRQSRPQTAPEQMKGLKSILKKRPEINRQTSFTHSDGTGTPGYAKTFKKNRDFHIDPTLFRHFGEAALLRNTASAASRSKQATPQQNTPIKGRKSVEFYSPDSSESRISEQEEFPEEIFSEKEPAAEEYQRHFSSQTPKASELPINYSQEHFYEPVYQQMPPFVPYQYYTYDYNSYPQSMPYSYPYPYQNSDPQMMMHNDPNYSAYYNPYPQTFDDQFNNQEPQVPQQKLPFFRSKSETKLAPKVYPKRILRQGTKPIKPHYIPLSQTIMREPNINRISLRKPKLKANASDSSIKMHAKDIVTNNPKGGIRKLYSDNHLEPINSEDPLY